MLIDIPDYVCRHLEQLAQGTGQDVGALVYEAIEQRLTREEQKHRPQGSAAWQPFADQDSLVALIGSCETEGSPSNAQTRP